jgi:hypothetical protein
MKLRARWMAVFALMAAIGAVACSHSASGSSTAEQNAGGAQNFGGSGSAARAGALPNGYQSVTDADGTGQLLWVKVAAGQKSATGAMRDSLGALKNYFDAAPQFISAVSDSQDQVVQVMISAKLKGQTVTGVATTVIGSAGGVFGLVYDRPTALKSSFGNLSNKFRAQLPQSGNSGQPFSLTPPSSWSRQTAGDKSGAANLPSGWQARGCNQGTMDIVGPHGEYVELGEIAFVATQALPGANGMVSPYVGPVPAFSFFTNYVTKMNRASGVNLINVPGKVIESKAVAAPMQGGEGAYMLQQMTVNGTPYKVYALVYTARLPMSGWQFYTSYVAAPAAVFDSEFGDMMRIWSSWKVDDKVYQQIMQQTLQTMQSTSDMINHSTEYQINAQENLQASMLNIINDQTSVADTTTGTVSQVSTANAQKMLDDCKTSGLNCKVVPFNQLASGGH